MTHTLRNLGVVAVARVEVTAAGGWQRQDVGDLRRPRQVDQLACLA